jgi:carboxymethylenebutenolidase
MVRYGGDDYTGYFALPERAAKPLPAVLVIQEAWGVNEHIEDVTRRFARAGYAALAPDLYARRGTRQPELTRQRLTELLELVNRFPTTFFLDAAQREAELSRLPVDKAARIAETFATMLGSVRQPDTHMPALLAATEFLRNENPATRGQKVGSVGYCMGGGLSALLACRDSQLAVAVVYYGSSPPAEHIPAIECPVFGFYGGEDARINGGVPAFAEAMKAAAKRFESRTYPGVQHAFFNDNRPAYDVRASRDAFARTLGIFREHLGS